MMRHCRARLRPLRSQLRELLFSVGTTSVTMGMAGRYLAIRLAVRPELAYTMIKPACRVRAGGIYRRHDGGLAAVALKSVLDLAHRHDLGEPGMQQPSRTSSKGLAVPGTQHLLLCAAG